MIKFVNQPKLVLGPKQSPIYSPPPSVLLHRYFTPQNPQSPNLEQQRLLLPSLEKESTPFRWIVASLHRRSDTGSASLLRFAHFPKIRIFPKLKKRAASTPSSRFVPPRWSCRQGKGVAFLLPSLSPSRVEVPGSPSRLCRQPRRAAPLVSAVGLTPAFSPCRAVRRLR